MNLCLLAGGVLVFLMGGLFAVATVSTLRERLQVQRTPTSAMGEALEGVVEVQGTVSELSTVVPSPVEGIDCVWWRLVVEQDGGGKSGWRAVYDSYGQGVCLVTDDRGAVRLDIDTPHVEGLGHVEPVVGDRDVVEAWLLSEGDEPLSGEPVRWTETRLEVGDPVIALGVAVDVGDGEFPLLAGGTEQALIVAKGNEEQLVRQQGNVAALLGFFAVFFWGVSAALVWGAL